MIGLVTGHLKEGVILGGSLQLIALGWANVGEPLFWFTLIPILGATLALTGNILGSIIFFFAWNIIRIAFEWYTQEFGYKVGRKITNNLSGGLLGTVTQVASILGMFIIGELVNRWVNISFAPIVSSIQQQPKIFIDWANLSAGPEGIKHALTMYDSIGSTALDPIKTPTLQNNLDQLIPGLSALLLKLLCAKLLKRKVFPILIILVLFAVGIFGHVIGLL